MSDFFTFSTIIIMAVISTVILIALTNKIRFSCIAAVLLVEGSVMLYNYITIGSIAQFGLLPYFIALPFLLIGSMLGALLWLFVISKFIAKLKIKD